MKEYLADVYSKIDYNKKSIQDFLSSIYYTMKKIIPLDKNSSLLDIGCGRGYFIVFLERKGMVNISGLEPSEELTKISLSDKIKIGSFENNNCVDNSYDIVFCSHTLHHLKEREPVSAISEMKRITKKYVVIIEVNNNNLPVFLYSLLNIRNEKNALFYNLRKMKRLFNKAGLKTIYAKSLNSGFVRSDNIFFRIMKHIGNKPYNIIIGEK